MPPSTPWNPTTPPRPQSPSRTAASSRLATTPRSGRSPERARRSRTFDGATVIPGLIDAHNHLLATGRVLGQVQLYDCRSIPEITERIAARVRETPPGAWIIGRGWDESLLAEGRHPTRHDLDRVAPDHPVLIHRVWNRLVANSRALQAAGISQETPDPPAA